MGPNRYEVSGDDDDGAYERGLELRQCAEQEVSGWVQLCTESALEDPHPFVRSEGARALMVAPDALVVPILASALETDNQTVRFRALRLLVRRDAKRAIAALEGELRAGDRERRLRAAEALGKFGPSALTALTALTASEETALRCRAAKGLAASGAPAAVTTLAAMLQDPAERVRLAALRAISRLADRPGLRDAFDEARAPLTSIIMSRQDGSENDPMRRLALLVLSKLEVRLPAEVRGQVSITADHEDLDLTSALRRVADPGPLVITEETLDHPDRTIRARAVRALAEDAHRNGALLEELSTSDPDDGVRWLATRARQGALSTESQHAERRRPEAAGPSATWPFGLPAPDPEEPRKERLPLALATVNLSYNLNLGVLIRSAEAAGASEVLIAGREYFHRGAAMGADKWVDIKAFETWPALVDYARDQAYQLVAVQQTPQAVPFDAADYPPRPCLVVGAEGQGLPPGLCAAADLVVHIPQRGEIDSINVASAAAVVLWTCLSHRGWISE